MDEKTFPQPIQSASMAKWVVQHGHMIIYPKKRLMKVLFGNPCENEYQEIKFSEP